MIAPTEPMLQYLRNVSEWLIDEHDVDESQALREVRDDLWAGMTAEERDATNALVERIFGEWL